MHGTEITMVHILIVHTIICHIAHMGTVSFGIITTEMMLLDIIIDGNYILSKLAFTLHKNNLLFGALYQALDNTIKNYRKWYPFSNIYLVSDSKEKSWRKQIISEYKSTRKKDSDIDWGFVYDTYSEFKEEMKKTIKVLEAPHIEGDDWISFLVEKSNREERSTIIVSNDYDIKHKLNKRKIKKMAYILFIANLINVQSNSVTTITVITNSRL